MSQNKRSLWQEVLIGKYGTYVHCIDGISSQLASKELSPIMQSLVKVTSNPDSHILYSHQFKWIIKDGQNAKFWNDH